MINLIEGKIELAKREISVVSNYEHLETLAENGLIEEREGGTNKYYYVESIADSMRFGIFVSLREKKIHWLVLHWLDGPCTSRGWEGVDEKVLKAEYHLLLNFVEKNAGGPPSNSRSRQQTWRFRWGQVDVSYEPRDFVAAIFMKPR